MQSEYNNIDKLVQDSFTELKPDLSHQQLHWKQMQGMLSNPVKPRNRNWLLIVAAALLVLIPAVYWVWNSNRISSETVAKLPTPVVQTNPVAVAQPKEDKGPEVKPLVPIVKIPKVVESYQVQSRIQFVEPEPFSINFQPCDSVTNKNEQVLTADIFFEKINKPYQEFEINADQGGVVSGAEGTQINIAPQSFSFADGQRVSGTIFCRLEEYYKYSDIIAANLNTISNGNLLITGGMIRFTAWQSNQELKLVENNPFKVNMPTQDFDPQMSLFLGKDEKKNNKTFNAAEFIRSPQEIYKAGNASKRKLNWTERGNAWLNISEDSMPLNPFIKVMVMENNPYRVKTKRGRSIALFGISNTAPLSDEAYLQMLKENYGDYYEEIQVKRLHKSSRWLAPYRNNFYGNEAIGDSAQFKFHVAKKHKNLSSEDLKRYYDQMTADNYRYANERVKWVNNSMELRLSGTQLFCYPGDESYQTTVDSLNILLKNRFENLKTEVAAKFPKTFAYSFTVPAMGWINCDRFYQNQNNLDFIVRLPEDAKPDNFVTQLVFTKIRSVMAGKQSGNRVGFLQIPANMEAAVVGMGEYRGKVVSFIQPVKTSQDEVLIKNLEETTPQKFQEALKQFDLK